MMNNLDNNDLPLSTFTITSQQLSILAERNGLNLFQQQNGLSLHELPNALQTSVASGIRGDETDIRGRQRAFGSNVVFEHQQPSSSFYELVSEALRDSTFGLLLCCATLSLVIGIERNGIQQGFLDGAIFFLAIFLSLHFGAIFKVVKARCMIKKRSSKRRNVVKVIRSGQTLQIPVSEVVVGEVVCLEPGDEVPADGIFISRDGNGMNLADANYYTAVFTGEKAAECEGLMVVTAVGKNTERQKLLKQSRKHQNLDLERSKLEDEIEKISALMQKASLCLSLLILAVQAVRCFLRKSWCEGNPNPDPKGVRNTVEEIMNETTRLLRNKGSARVNNSGLAATLCILLFALRDGLPLGIFITLLYASKKMNKCYGATVRKLPACATIGLVTTICTTKTGDLALHRTSMADLWIGFRKIENPTGEVENCVLDTLREGIGMNVCGVDDEDEVSLLLWAENVVGRKDIVDEDCQMLMSNHSRENLCGLMLERKKQGIRALHWKGEAKVILSMCSHYYDVDGTMQTLDDQEKNGLFNQIVERSSPHGSLRFVAFAYKQVRLHDAAELEDDGEDIDKERIDMMEENGLVLLGLVALRNPYGLELRHTIETCRKSGVTLKLVVDEDINTSRIMAFHSGIKGAVAEASDFRTQEERIDMVDEICALADSSPADQLLMVQCLRQKGEVVALTGSSVRQLPSLQESDVGIFMGDDDNNCGESMTQDADISLKDLNFGTIFEILMFGRYVCKNIQKFIELQVTLNVTAFTVTFIVQISNSTSEEPLTAFQLLWVSIIMDTLGALFLAKSTLEYPKYPKIQESHENSSRQHIIITMNTMRNIAIQSLFQVAVLLTLIHLNGKGILIFNSYALLQVFLLISKIMEIKKAVAADSGKSRLTFLVFMVLLVFVSLQVVVSEIMAAIFHWEKLGFKQWVLCVGISSISIPIAYAANLISAIKRMI